MIYNNEGKNLVKIWDNKVEDNVMEQIKNVSNLPFAYRHIAVMADNHLGFGCPIGTVFAAKNVIVPSLVGSDIGCGVCAVKTSLTEIDTETLKKIMGKIRKVIPVGFNKHKEAQDTKLMPRMDGIKYICDEQIEEEFEDSVYRVGAMILNERKNALKSLGTLGGGNHFIEIQKGNDGYIWIMIHSGSRNLGLKVANHYNKLAVELNKKWYSQVPKEYELAFLPVDSKEGQAYIREMNYCVDFAFANRKLMMDRIRNIFSDQFDYLDAQNDRMPGVGFDIMINIAHNYASQENHFGSNVWVHRKGATQARKGQIGIIPGSMGTSSYIVEGLGNPESFESCSHGAGRVMSRKQAIKNLNLKEEIKILDDQNIIHGIRYQDDLDESVSCYKNINEVMENQKDLVKILVKLKPLGVIKG